MHPNRSSYDTEISYFECPRCSTKTEDTVSITFDIPAELKADYQYLSGQYLTLKTTLNGEEVRRSYSLHTAPFEGIWSVAVKKLNMDYFQPLQLQN